MLCALLLLTQPNLARRIETAIAPWVCLPLRGLVALAPVPAAATSAIASGRESSASHRVALARDAEPGANLRSSLGDSLVLAVLDRRSNRNGFLDELILDVRRDALPHAMGHVTFGDSLVGFLSPRAVEADDPLAGLARVELLGYRSRYRMPRRVPAQIVMGDEAPLAMLVEPSGSIDRWPLRCALLDDPYRAAQLAAGGQSAYTSGLREDPLGVLPAGLGLGTLRVFGYRNEGGRVLPIDLLIEPSHDPRTLDAVCVWFATAPDAPAAGTRARRVPVRLRRLPVPVPNARRFLATVATERAALVAGAPVLDGDRLLGVCTEVGERFAVVTEFGSLGESWHLRWWARADSEQQEGASVAIRAHAIARDRDRVVFELESPLELSSQAEVFTCARSPSLPAGLWLGTARRLSALQFELRHPGLVDRDDLAVRVLEVLR